MYPADPSLTRMIREVLYHLKRQYGGTIDIYRLESSTVNPRTGVVTKAKSVTRIDRAVILPATVKRDVVRGISLISANKMLVQGGTYDASSRMFIIERYDCPGWDLRQDDWLVYGGRKYEIAHFQEFEFRAGWVVIGRCLIGERPEQVFEVYVDDTLQVESEVSDAG